MEFNSLNKIYTLFCCTIIFGQNLILQNAVSCSNKAISTKFSSKYYTFFPLNVEKNYHSFSDI